MPWAEDSTGKLILCSHSVDPKDQTQIIRLMEPSVQPLNDLYFNSVNILLSEFSARAS